jgi:FMN-dependent NADH-azoreductase
MKLLHVDSSILGDASVSRALTAELVAGWRRQAPGVAVAYRDLAAAPLPQFSAALLAARALPPAERSIEQQRAVEAGDGALEEFLAADVVVVGAPMYNFTIPSQLKTWIDHLAVAGRTFRYTADGPEGLAGGKKVIVVSSRGGFYGAGTALEAIDFQERYLRAVFGFFGIADLEFVRAEGLNISPEHKRQAIEAARREIAGRTLAAAA